MSAHEMSPNGIRHDGLGYWMADVGSVAPAAALTGQVTADVVIVGGGYAGMWTALELRRREPDARVVVLDSGICGEGPSGRNAGFVNALWHRLGALADRFGDAAAMDIAAAAAPSVDEIGAWAERQGADIWFRKAGHLEVSTSEVQDDRWMPSVERCARLGVPGEYVALGRDEVAGMCASPLFRGGAFMPQSATVHPARLARALRTALLESGITLYEHSRVQRMRETQAGVLAETASGGRVVAGRAVIAVNAATSEFRALRNRLTVSSTHMVMTEPVPDVLEAAGWTGGECVSTTRTYLHYFRTTPDGRIAFGFGGGRIGYGARLGGRVEVDRKVIERVRADLVRLFPGLAGRRVVHAWGGPVDVSPTKLPVIGTLPDGRIHYVYGFTGNGVGPSHLAAKVLTSLVLDARDELTRLALVEPPAARVPPEPLRYLGGSLVRSALLHKENREDAGRPVDPVTSFVVDMPRRVGIHIGR